MDPHLSISVHPLQRGYRFRYICEGSAHGPMPGEGSTKENKIFPTLRIDNCRTQKPVFILVSLCSDGKHDVHMHTLFGKNVFNGEYIDQITPDEHGTIVHQIRGVSVLHTKAKSKIELLGCKLAQNDLLVSNGISEYTAMMKSSTAPSMEFNIQWFRDKIQYLQNYINRAGEINAANNVVCLKIQAFVFDPVLDTYYSNDFLLAYSKAIYDCKTPQTAPLKIQRLSRISGSMEGNDEIYLLCDKVDKNDISIEFFLTDNGQRKVIGQGHFAPTDVFHQVVIIFRTPKCPYFWNEPIDVHICLRRKIDANEVSAPFDFKYLPSQPPYAFYQSDSEFPSISNTYTYFPQQPYYPGQNPRFGPQQPHNYDIATRPSMYDPNITCDMQSTIPNIPESMDHSTHSSTPQTSNQQSDNSDTYFLPSNYSSSQQTYNHGLDFFPENSQINPQHNFFSNPTGSSNFQHPI